MARNFFLRCLTGDAPLWQAFWIGSVAGTAIVVAIFSALAPALSASSINPGLARALVLGISLGYAVFSSVGVWRCARDPKGSPLHALAKVYAVISVIAWLILVVTALLWNS